MVKALGEQRRGAAGQPQIITGKEGSVYWRGSMNLWAQFRATKGFCYGYAVPVFGLATECKNFYLPLKRRASIFGEHYSSSSPVPVPSS